MIREKGLLFLKFFDYQTRTGFRKQEFLKNITRGEMNICLKNTQMLYNTLKIFEQGYYEKNGEKIYIKLSKEEREECVVIPS